MLKQHHDRFGLPLFLRRLAQVFFINYLMVLSLLSVPEEKYLTLDGFHRFVVDRSKQDIRSVWRAILSCGYDLHFERWVLEASSKRRWQFWMCSLWTSAPTPCGMSSQVWCHLHFRCACIDARHAQKASRKWTLEMDVALVQYINRLCRHLAITPARLHPHEVYLDPADAADPRISCLLSTYAL